MIVVKIQGGLGNQMFQYAAGAGAAKGAGLGLDLSWYKTATEWWRPYELHKFGIVNPPHQFVSQVLEGYFVSDRFMAGAEEKVRAAFTFQNKLKPFRKKEPTVSVHVRRGAAPDFGGEAKADPETHVLPVEYYRKAIYTLSAMLGSIQLVIFSDDPEWCRQNLEFPAIYPQQSGFDDLQLMSLCDHHIVANSSFSWWGAWLNPREKIVVCPEGTSHVVFPQDWLRV